MTGPKPVGPPPGVGPKASGPDAWTGTVGAREGQLYCAEQVRVPDTLEAVVRLWTKAVLRERPSDIVAFSARWFADQHGGEDFVRVGAHDMLSSKHGG
ncbi:hypothetical protein T492DRAFT_867010 [Pavlovales sp. CCMP2436]|nr:hypothetical protein T492DRAFT_867010 [Pavlovales sp. CCMP2436]